MNKNEKPKGFEGTPERPKVPGAAPETPEQMAARQARYETIKAESARSIEAGKAQAAQMLAEMAKTQAAPAAPVAEAKPAKAGFFDRVASWFRKSPEKKLLEAELAEGKAKDKAERAAELASATPKAEFKAMMKAGAASAKAESMKAEQIRQEQGAEARKSLNAEDRRVFSKEGAAISKAEGKAAKAEANLEAVRARAELGADASAAMPTYAEQAAAGLRRAGELAKSARELTKKGPTVGDLAGAVAEKAKTVGMGAAAIGVGGAMLAAEGLKSGSRKAGELAGKAKDKLAEDWEETKGRMAKRGETVGKAVDFARDVDIHAAGMSVVDKGLDLGKKGAEIVGKGAKAVVEGTKHAASATSELAGKAKEKLGEDWEETKGRMAKRGEAVGKAVDFARDVDIHAAGMKAVDTGIKGVEIAGKGIAKGAKVLVEQSKRAASAAGDAVTGAMDYVEHQAVGSGGLLERAVQKTGKVGEKAGDLADKFLKAPVKGLEKGLELAAKTEDMIASGLHTAAEGTVKKAKQLREFTKSGPTVTEAAMGIAAVGVGGAMLAAEGIKATGRKAKEKLGEDWEETKGRMAKRGEAVGKAVDFARDVDIHAAGMSVVDKGLDLGKKGAEKVGEAAKGAVAYGAAGVEGAKKLAKAAVEADIHAAGMKVVDTGLDLGKKGVELAGKGAKAVGEKLRVKERQPARDMNEAAWVQELQNGPVEQESVMEGAPEGIVAAVQEAAAERRLPRNFNDEARRIAGLKGGSSFRPQIDAIGRLIEGVGTEADQAMRDQYFDGWTNEQLEAVKERAQGGVSQLDFRAMVKDLAVRAARNPEEFAQEMEDLDAYAAGKSLEAKSVKYPDYTNEDLQALKNAVLARTAKRETGT